MTTNPRTRAEHAERARELLWDAGDTRGKRGMRLAFLAALRAIGHALLASTDGLDAWADEADPRRRGWAASPDGPWSGGR